MFPTPLLIALTLNKRTRPIGGIMAVSNLMRRKIQDQCPCSICVLESKKRYVLRSFEFFDFS